MPEHIEIVGTWLNETVRRASKFGTGDWLIGQVQLDNDERSRIEVITLETEHGPRKNISYRFYGNWKQSAGTFRKKRQFDACANGGSFVPIEPLGRTGIIYYLQEAPHIGQTIAKQIFERYGKNSIEVVKHHWEKLAGDIKGLSYANAEAASKHLLEMESREKVTVELMDLLGKKGFPKSAIDTAVKRWGNRAPRIIKASPFIMMQFHRVGFSLCDKLYLDLGYNPHRLKRQAMCAYYAVASNRDGHTWIHSSVIMGEIDRMIGSTNARPAKALELAIRGKILEADFCRNGRLISKADATLDDTWITTKANAWQELRVAKYVLEAIDESY